MRKNPGYYILFCIVVLSVITATTRAMDMPDEEQLTFAPQSHWLDNNDNFSADGRFLCYDTRESVGPGIDNGQSIEVLELGTGRSIILYKPESSVVGEKAAPGVGAVSFSLAENEVAFIHGPPVNEVAERGYYGKPNRNGAQIRLDGEIVEKDGCLYMLKDGQYSFSWIDKRDVAKDRDTIPGAHRGGTHRHEYSHNGKRIGFTYDDFLLPQYDRNIGYMEANPKAPAPASHYFAVLAPIKPKGKSRAGELEKAYGDSWVDLQGTMRAFIGVVRDEDGVGYQESLYVVDIPADVDITSADSGGSARYPSPPQGTRIRRLTHDWAGGIVRGAPDGSRIAYYGKDAEGRIQLFTIAATGSDRSEQPEMRPRQVTFLERGTEAGLRWLPSGNALLSIADNGIVVTWCKDGPAFGKSKFLTTYGDGKDRHAPVISPDGKWIAYNCPKETRDSEGHTVKNYAGQDFIQIFRIPLPELTESMF